ncbi:FAD-dependent monooxygenase [Vannielia litorea]|uniref:2-octaprenyl-6-methoxyphenol hydroxylase n=1 Tax=Vannielia litorea TaxID=1217970 RepID=A0A1N6EJ80_9RHOB|nr:FAD-dependent monooxygenase [Vannielia litorea]SIN83099.1 2-octaprenyl-6-methoxyphenol hydroxylase [Vannielia litorea]
MTRETTDILIAGAGIAGLTAAACFGQAGYRVTLAAPAPPRRDKTQGDQRSTAFLDPAIALFSEAGLWARLAPHAQPLQELHITDTTGWPPRTRDSRAFRSDAPGTPPLAQNLMNWRIADVLLNALESLPNVALHWGAGFASMVTREREALVRLTDDSSLRARLVIGADGRDSAVRETAGITAEISRFGQKALAFSVTHPEPHRDISTEVYNQGGPFTLIPLPDEDGTPTSAVVWMNPGPEALRLQALDAEAFSAEATTRSAGLLGPLTLASPRAVFPIITLRSRALTAQRTALIAEAAHVIPPIGAQGLNTSLNDLAALLKSATPDALGSRQHLDRYENSRARDVAARVAAIGFYNRLTRSGLPPLQSLRLSGLKAVADLPPLRRAVMKAGMGG